MSKAKHRIDPVSFQSHQGQCVYMGNALFRKAPKYSNLTSSCGSGGVLKLRRLALSTIAVSLVLSLAGCGSPKPTSPNVVFVSRSGDSPLSYGPFPAYISAPQQVTFLFKLLSNLPKPGPNSHCTGKFGPTYALEFWHGRLPPPIIPIYPFYPQIKNGIIKSVLADRDATCTVFRVGQRTTAVLNTTIISKNFWGALRLWRDESRL